MVYLNPSHGGSRRSSSIRSNNSMSQKSDMFSNSRIDEPLTIIESAEGQQEVSIQQAYQQEGRYSK